MIINPQRQARLAAAAQQVDGMLHEIGLPVEERLDFILGLAASYSWLLQRDTDDVQRRFLALRQEAAKANPDPKV